MSMNVYSRVGMYSTPRPPETIFLPSSWSQRAAAVFLLVVLIIAAESILKRLSRGSKSSTLDEADVERRMNSKGYREFIKSEMMRIRKEEEIMLFTGSQQGYSREKLGKSRYKIQPKSEFEGEQEMLFKDSIRELRDHSEFFRPPGTLISTRSKTRTSAASCRPTRKTPTRKVKSEYQARTTIASSVSSRSDLASESDHITSPVSSVPSSTPSITADDSATPKLPSPAATSPLPTAIPKQGDIVLRRRPESSFLMGTVDETDLYDGPFIVLSTKPPKWVELLLPEGSKTPPWVTAANVVLAANEAKNVHTGLGIQKDGGAVYVISKLRGVRPKKAGKKGRDVLVHWKGWGCEDDTWEPAEGLSVIFLKEFEKRDRQWKLGIKG